MRAHKLIAPLLLAALLLLSCGCAAGESRETGEVLLRTTGGLGKTTTYKLQEIGPTEIGHSANLTVNQSWQLVKPVRSGSEEYILKKICVSRGQQVKAGDPIAILQGLGSEADIELKKLEIEAFESRTSEMLARYTEQIETAEDMPTNTSAQRQRRELQLEYAQLEYRRYELQSAQSLANLNDQLADLEAAAGEIVLTAPVDGSIHNLTSRYVPGDMLPANTELCTVYGSEGLRFYGSSSTGVFVYGREVTVSMGKGNRSATVTARVVSSPEVAAGAGAYNSSVIIFEVDATEAELVASDGNATVTYTLLSGVYAVPKSCIKTRDGVSCVDLLIGDTVCTRNVVRGPAAGGMVCILHGLSEGDQVVVSSYRS